MKTDVGTWAAMFMYFVSSYADLALHKVVIFHDFYIFYFHFLFLFCTVKISKILKWIQHNHPMNLFKMFRNKILNLFMNFDVRCSITVMIIENLTYEYLVDALHLPAALTMSSPITNRWNILHCQECWLNWIQE